MQTVLLLEDHNDTRAWLAEILRQTFEGITIYEAASLKQAREHLSQQSFDLGIIDINLPDGSGIDIIREIAQSSPETYVVVATIFDDDQHIFEALQAGAHGYLLKEQQQEQLLARLQGILDGEPPLSPAIARRILRHFHSTADSEPQSMLTDREKEVLTLIAKGMSRSDISRLLGITVNTAAGHIKNIYRKLNICSRAEAALEATRLGLLRSDRQ